MTPIVDEDKLERRYGILLYRAVAYRKDGGKTFFDVRKTKSGYRVIDVCAEGITSPGMVENCILKDFESARWLADKYAKFYTGK